MIMKRMLFVLSVVALFCMSSCSSYYYSVLESNDAVGEKNDDKDFVIENDSVCIYYCFYGEDAPISITVYNKMDEPLFVDWQRSALIIDDVATSYYQENAPIQGQTESSSYGDSFSWSRRYSSTDAYSSGSFAGQIALPKGVSFIPPRSKVESTPLRLTNFPFDRIPKGAYTTQKFAKSNSDVVNVKVKKFTEDDSPLSFRSYLSLYTANPENGGKNYSSYESSFYVAQLIKTGNVPPASFDAGKKQAGDFFYVHKVKGADAGIIVGAVAIGAAGIVIESTLTPDHY